MFTMPTISKIGHHRCVLSRKTWAIQLPNQTTQSIRVCFIVVSVTISRVAAKMKPRQDGKRKKVKNLSMRPTRLASQNNRCFCGGVGSIGRRRRPVAPETGRPRRNWVAMCTESPTDPGEKATAASIEGHFGKTGRTITTNTSCRLADRFRRRRHQRP